MVDLLRRSEVQITRPVLRLNRRFPLDLDLRFGFALNSFGDLGRPQAEVLLIPDHGGFGILRPKLRMARVGDPFIAAQLGECVLHEGLCPSAKVRAFGDDCCQVPVSYTHLTLPTSDLV